MHILSRHIFDRVALINLDRRTDRLHRVIRNISDCQWPFIEPVRVRAVDASDLSLPPFWFAGRGAFGCMRSHQRVLEDAIMDGVKSLLVLEDDVVFRRDFGPKVLDFIASVPEDWDQLMIGGQTMNDSVKEQVAPGVLRVTNCQRSHCYAVRGQFIKELYAKWCGSYGHCDHSMGPFQSRYNVFAPDPFLAGQSEGHSDISGAHNPVRFWNEPLRGCPVFWLKCDRALVKDLWKAALHAGRIKSKEGVDVGLVEIIDSPDGFFRKKERILEWISMIEWEGRSMTPESFCCIWNPDLDGDLLEEIVGDRLVQIESNNIDEIRETVLVSVRKAQEAIAAQ